MQPSVMLRQVAQVFVPVLDLDRAVRFYRDVLRLQPLLVEERLAFLMCGATRLMLALPEDRTFAGRHPVIYYAVDDIEQTWRELEEQGVEYVDRPHRVATMGEIEIWMAFLRDPESNIFAITAERAVARPT